MRLQPGSVFAGYTIEQLLDSSGMAMVYLARHPRLERRVALQVLSDALCSDPKIRTSFEQKAALAARLDHPNIVPVYDRSDGSAEMPWIAMKYVSGSDTVS